MSQSIGDSDFRPSGALKTPEPIDLKFGMIDYVRDGTTRANFGGDRLSGGYWANTPLVPLFLSFFTSYFFDSISKPTADTAEPILTRDSSYDVSS